MGAASKKTLYCEHIKKHKTLFRMNPEVTERKFPTVSSLPFKVTGLVSDFDEYTKKKVDGCDTVTFILKNKKTNSFQWRPTPQNLKQAVSWGIIHVESATAKVISSLGRYRIKAHERIVRGTISNTHQFKMDLLDHYQSRFEALQRLELLANKGTTKEDFYQAFIQYKLALQEMVPNIRQCSSEFNQKIKKDIEAEIKRADEYLAYLNKQESLKLFNRARGTESILEFVKKQMTHGLYEMQGINQDFTFSKNRSFAFTRGELNDAIEIARIHLDEHQADLRNAVTKKHHGDYSESTKELIYDFKKDHLSPEEERQAMMAISFIEGWDTVDLSHPKKPLLKNRFGESVLKVITATRWQITHNIKTFVKKIGYLILNMFKSFVTSTRPWQEGDNDFRLVTK
jgi:hypothetical protein